MKAARMIGKEGDGVTFTNAVEIDQNATSSGRKVYSIGIGKPPIKAEPAQAKTPKALAD